MGRHEGCGPRLDRPRPATLFRPTQGRNEMGAADEPPEARTDPSGLMPDAATDRILETLDCLLRSFGEQLPAWQRQALGEARERIAERARLVGGAIPNPRNRLTRAEGKVRR